MKKEQEVKKLSFEDVTDKIGEAIFDLDDIDLITKIYNMLCPDKIRYSKEENAWIEEK